ncbi:hypothetical protein SRHO_G00170080 [Serrasalmus rhombeus]
MSQTRLSIGVLYFGGSISCAWIFEENMEGKYHVDTLDCRRRSCWAEKVENNGCCEQGGLTRDRTWPATLNVTWPSSGRSGWRAQGRPILIQFSEQSCSTALCAEFRCAGMVWDQAWSMGHNEEN